MAAPNLVETHINPELQQMEENRAARKARINRPRWNPKEWHPVYEEVVLLDCMGLSRSDIAVEKGFTEEHITSILKTEQAKIIRRIVEQKIREKHDFTVEQRLERLANKAMTRVEDVINNDKVAETNPLGLFDRAIVLLKATKKIAPEEPGTNIGKALIVTDAAMDKLIKGMAVADEARRLHALPPITIDAKSSTP